MGERTSHKRYDIAASVAAASLLLGSCTQVVEGSPAATGHNVTQNDPAGNSRGVISKPGMDFECRGITKVDLYNDQGHRLGYFPVVSILNQHENPTDRYVFTVMSYQHKLTDEYGLLFSKGTQAIEFNDGTISPLGLYVVDFSASKKVPLPTTVEEVQGLQQGLGDIVPDEDITVCPLQIAPK